MKKNLLLVVLFVLPLFCENAVGQGFWKSLGKVVANSIAEVNRNRTTNGTLSGQRITDAKASSSNETSKEETTTANNNVSNDDVTLVVTGDGKTKEEATKVALRSAIEQVYGTFVSANTSLVNDELTKDEIVTISSGNIKSYEEIESLSSDDYSIVTLKATVSISTLVSYAKSKGASAEFAGSTFGMNMKIKELNRKNEQVALDNLLDVITSFLPALFDRELVLDEPRLPNDKFKGGMGGFEYSVEKFYRYVKGDQTIIKRKQEMALSQLTQWANSNSYLVTMTINYSQNENTEQLLSYILQTLNAISLSSEELKEYSRLGLNWSRYDFMKTDFYFRNSLADINAWNRNLVHAFYDYFTNFVIVDNLGNKSYFEGYDEKFKYMAYWERPKYTDFMLTNPLFFSDKVPYYYILKGHGLFSPFFKLMDVLIGPYTYWGKYSDLPDELEYAYINSAVEYASFRMDTWPKMVIEFLIPANDISKYSNFEIQDKD